MSDNHNHEITPEELTKILDDGKAEDIIVLNVQSMTPLIDTMIVATGNSPRQLQALANRIVSEVKPRLSQKPSIEGIADSGWLLIDLGATIMHIMLNETRNFYRLEELWTATPPAE